MELVGAADIHIGRFAQLAIATHPLSYVNRHIAHTFLNTIVQHYKMMQLNRTINALKHL